MSTRPIKNSSNLIPIIHILIRHLLYRSSRNNHPVIFLVAHQIKVMIECFHMFYRRIFDVWLFNFINDISNCKGVLESKRTKSVSVVIFNGIKFNITIFNGRISCALARELSMTKIFPPSAIQ